MPAPFEIVKAFRGWWLHNLLHWLPAGWSGYLSGDKGNFDLLIMHQQDAIVAMNNHGVILDSVSLAAKARIDLANLPAEDSVVGRLSNTQLRATEELVAEQDPGFSIGPGSVDIDLTEPRNAPRLDTLDLELNSGEPAADSHGDSGTPGRADKNNVISLNRPRDNDITLMLADDDQTMRFFDAPKDDDTIVIKSDQGNLLQSESDAAGPRDTTVMFRSFGGKIRPVDPTDLEAQQNIPDTKTDLDLDLGIGELPQSGDAFEYLAVAKLLGRHQGRKKSLYLLPDDKVLTLDLAYPVEVLQNIENVLRYDLEKHIPLSKQEVRYFYALNLDEAKDRVQAEVAVIKSEEYDALSQSLEPYVRNGFLCTTESFFRKFGNRINFLERNPDHGWKGYFKPSNLHLALNWLLFIAMLATPYLTFYQGRDAIAAKSPDEIRRVKALVSEFNATSAESNFGSLLSEQVNQAPRMVELLSLLSDNINRQAWLQQFSYKNNEIRIKGEAVSATSVSDDLNSTGLFQSIKFVSSIVKNARTGNETFELSLRLKPDA